MNLKTSQTWLCWHCDASIPKGSHVCPFCGNHLDTPPHESSSSSDYTLPQSPVHEESKPPNHSLLLVFSLVGSTLILFSLILWLFSTGGVLELRWNSHFWPLYLLIGSFCLGWAITRSVKL